MSKHEKKTSSLLHYPVLVVFSLFFIGLFALDMVTPDRSYSELENTTLSQRPALTQFTAKGLNSYFTAYTKYVKDQVFGRDEWISLQSVVETTLLQKEQNGGILLGKEHMMFPRTFGLLSSEERTLPKNTSAVESLCQRYPGKVNVLLAPAASDIYPENVPVNAPLLDENTYLDQLSAAVQAAGGRFVDVRGTLTDHKGEDLYYRTARSRSITAPTTTGRAWALITPTSSCALPWALRLLTPPPTRPRPPIASTAPTTPRPAPGTPCRTPSPGTTCPTS